jgi:hypothetical protein
MGRRSRRTASLGENGKRSKTWPPESGTNGAASAGAAVMKTMKMSTRSDMIGSIPTARDDGTLNAVTAGDSEWMRPDEKFLGEAA